MAITRLDYDFASLVPGVTRTSPGQFRVKVFSSSASAVSLFLFDPTGRDAGEVPLSRSIDGWWGADFRSDIENSYGLRVDGPYDPSEGLLHNPNKILFDPYAKSFRGKLGYGDVTRVHAPFDYLGMSEIDSIGNVPLGLLPGEGLGFDKPGIGPNYSLKDSILYETHVKSATQRMSAIAPSIRGTYLGISSKPFIEHLRKLSITAIELLPIFYFADSEVLLANHLVNHWGYSTMSFFAPDPRYATSYDFGVAKSEFAQMVDTLHANGIEVILDVVYNHTGEGDLSGPTFSYRGISPRDYYLMEPFGRYHVDLTGCGNTMNASSLIVQRLIIDSLTHFANDYSIDGFRFDLATSLGRSGDARTGYAFSPGGGVLGAIMTNEALTSKKLIMEPWDLGNGGYQVGNFAGSSLEWNDRFRDVFRRAMVLGDSSADELAQQIIGDGDLLSPNRSLNFVTCHDGFTLRDLVSYTQKHNLLNHEDNRDGAHQNYSNNFGHEGLDAEASILDARDRIRRMLVAALAIAPGVPMVLGGDEIGRTQFGNNNAYCQDRNDYSFDWESVDLSFMTFFRKALDLRRRYIPTYNGVQLAENGDDRAFSSGGACKDLIVIDYNGDQDGSIFRVLINIGVDECKASLNSDIEAFRSFIVLDSTAAFVDSTLTEEYAENNILVPAKGVIGVVLEAR